MAGVTFENAIVAGGRFKIDGGDIETITVPATTTWDAFSILGRAGGKYILSLNAATDGTEVAVAVLAEEVVNDTASPIDIQAVVYKKGTFNSAGVTFGTGQTLSNTKDSLHEQSIEIVEGV